MTTVNNKRNLENLDFSNTEESEDEYSVCETDQSEDENYSTEKTSSQNSPKEIILDEHREKFHCQDCDFSYTRKSGLEVHRRNFPLDHINVIYVLMHSIMRRA